MKNVRAMLSVATRNEYPCLSTQPTAARITACSARFNGVLDDGFMIQPPNANTRS